VSLGTILGVWRSALAGWWNDNVPRMGASLSYYTLFSVAPILVIAIAIAGAVFGQDAARGEITRQLEGLIGTAGARTIDQIVRQAQQSPRTGLASTLGVLTFVLGASGAFTELETALNDIWKVESKTAGRGLLGMILDRLISFGLVAAVGFLLLASLLISAGLAALGQFLHASITLPELIWQGADLLVSLIVITTLFALIYRVLPNVLLRPRDLWVGAAVTAVLFSLGKFGIGLYLGHSSVASAYGAAGSVVVLVAWVYYAAQVVLLGAEFTKSYAAARHPADPSRKKTRPEVRRPANGSGSADAPSK
jgi:membrane protein